MGARANRRVITFYSFKGGVGRTMTLANIAHRLAFHHGLRVIAVDWDLEAPGLHSFFRLPAGALKNARGLLDYCEAWETSYAEQAPEPPNPLSFLMPVEAGTNGGTNEETRGSLRLLIAGKQDEHYDARLGRFDWKRFYAQSLGAGAVEHLRNRFAEDADLVLVDSRTGLTDPGGICTIQIPDAVVLMTAPNEQSLEGIERIAQSIAAASPEARVGKDIARVFLCMSRVPIVEETYLARQWFKKHKAWFTRGVESGLWHREDHRLGLETHVIPQRAAYGFGESLVGRAVGTLEREPLAQAYDALTAHLLLWVLDPGGTTLDDHILAIRARQDVNATELPRVERELRHLIESARQIDSMRHEVYGIRKLLDLGSHSLFGYVLPDEAQLRQRLVELAGLPDAPASPAPIKTKRRRAK